MHKIVISWDALQHLRASAKDDDIKLEDGHQTGPDQYEVRIDDRAYRVLASRAGDSLSLSEVILHLNRKFHLR